MAVWEAIQNLGERAPVITPEALAEERAKAEQRSRDNRVSELWNLRKNSVQSLPSSWGQNSKRVWGVWESGLDAFNRAFSSVIPEKSHTVQGYISSIVKGKENASVLEVGGTAGQLSKDIHALPGMEKVFVVGASLTDPRVEGVSAGKNSPFPSLPNHEIIIADAFSKKGHAGTGGIGGSENPEHTEPVSLQGMNAIRNPRSKDGKFTCIVVKMEKPMLSRSGPEQMHMVSELINGLYEKLEPGGALMLQLPGEFPVRRFADTIRNSDKGRGIKVHKPHRSIQTSNIIIERQAGSADSLTPVFEKKPLIKVQEIKKKKS
ncbi:hypothetical protein K2P56_01505 [Patescibacteria group bacterium]|nr:hypothetical protein [Patescibacteria group bacterium]